MTKRQLSAEEVRQGKTPHKVRYVLGISTATAIVALIIVFVFAV